MQKYRKIHIIVALVFILLFFRFYFFQIHEHLKYEVKAGNNSLRQISLHAPRGIIYDRNKIPIVDNRQIYDIEIIPFDVTDKYNFDLLTNLTGISSTTLKKDIGIRKKSFNRFRPYVIKRHISFEVRSLLEENKLDLPGTIFSEFPARIYPSKAKLTHVLGYLRVVTDNIDGELKEKYNYKSGDIFGYSGIEKMYERLLRGKDGTQFRLVDIYGIDHGKYENNLGVEPISGQDLYIGIDSQLQAYIEKIFVNKKGSVICMLPETGEIIAYLSAPDYDLNSFTGPVPLDLWNAWNNDVEKPLLNRGIHGLYPPGSTFKLVAAALAIEKDVVTKDWNVNCNGVYNYGDRDFHCWNTEGHGQVNLEKAIIQSCNIYFYHLVQKLSLDDWGKMAYDFGFGKITGVDLFGEKAGNIPSRSYLNKKYGKYGWAGGNLLTFIIGQGDLLVTPMQVGQMMNIIATRGNAIVPHFYINKNFETLDISLQPKTWDFLQKSVFEVVNNKNGTGKLAFIDDAMIHGKTGTAQNPHGEDHSWFAGYMINGNAPMLSLVVLVEHGGKGSVEAALISNKIFRFVNKNYEL